MIDRLFDRFSAMYGTRFLDMWRSIDIADVKKCWSDELSAYAISDVGSAVDQLKQHNFPPTLPEFLQHCETAKLHRLAVERPVRSTYTALPNSRPPSEQSPEWHAAKARCMETMKTFKMNRPPSRDWAYNLMERHEAGEILLPVQLQLAREAIRTDPDSRR